LIGASSAALFDQPDATSLSEISPASETLPQAPPPPYSLPDVQPVPVAAPQLPAPPISPPCPATLYDQRSHPVGKVAINV